MIQFRKVIGIIFIIYLSFVHLLISKKNIINETNVISYLYQQEYTSGCLECELYNHCDYAFHNRPGHFCGKWISNYGTTLPCCCPTNAECRITAYSCRCHLIHSYQNYPYHNNNNNSKNKNRIWWILFIIICILLFCCGFLYFFNLNNSKEDSNNKNNYNMIPESIPIAQEYTNSTGYSGYPIPSDNTIRNINNMYGTAPPAYAVPVSSGTYFQQPAGMEYYNTGNRYMDTPERSNGIHYGQALAGAAIGGAAGLATGALIGSALAERNNNTENYNRHQDSNDFSGDYGSLNNYVDNNNDNDDDDFSGDF